VRKLVLATLLFLVPMTVWGNSIANEHIVCVSPTSCPSGATTLITTSNPVNFDLTTEGTPVTGEAYLGILVPNSPSAFTVNMGSLEMGTPITFSSDHLGAAANLNEPGLTDFEFSAIQSAANGQAGVFASSFVASDWNLGAYDSSTGLNGIKITGLPKGTVIVGWIENSDGNALRRTPLSHSLTLLNGVTPPPPPTPTPEPTSLLLFGSGLLAVGSKLRKHFSRS